MHAVDAQWAKAFLRALGDELRQVRKQRGLTRQDVLDQSELDNSPQTVATYELGTRQCSVVRLVELAAVIDQPNLALELLARALERVIPAEDGLTLDLVAVARIEHTKLAPLRRWAKCRLRAHPEGQPTVVRLDLPALACLAELCEMEIVELIDALLS